MATKKDLVEAYSFSRRRLVTAFVSGAPGGREVEPTRPGRVLIGGVALSVLLLAGAAIAGFLIGRPNSEWLQTGSFVISKDTGEQYVVLRGGDDPVIQRVPNYVSAQLLLGQPELEPFTVRDKYIRKVRLGNDLGIDSAPAGLPSSSQLIDSGWAACTAPEHGIKLSLEEQPQVSQLRDSAFLVRGDKRLWLIATAPDVDERDGRAYRYQLPRNRTESDTFIDRLGFGAASQAPVVDQDWLNLFPEAPPLDAGAFGLTRVGQPAGYRDDRTDLSGYRIGDLLTTPDGNFYLLGDDNPQRLRDFAGILYDVVGSAAQPIDSQIVAGLDEPDYPREWPDTLPAAVASPQLCAVLYPEPDAQSRVVLATEPGPDASALEVDPGKHDVDVEPSGGAYVQSGSDDAATEGTPYVIDAKGAKYPLVGTEVPRYIGYGDSAAPVVPSSWMTFFSSGTELSTNAARRMPADAPPPSDGDASAEES